MLYFKMIVASFLREVRVIIDRFLLHLLPLFLGKKYQYGVFFQVFRINTLILKLNIN